MGFVGVLSLVVTAAAVSAGSGGTAQAASPSGLRGAGALGVMVANLGADPDDLLAGAPGVTPSHRVPDVAGCAAAALPWVPGDANAVSGRPAWLEAAGGGPVGALLRFDWFASGGATIAEAGRPARTLTVPLAMVDYVGQTTLLSVRNVEDRVTRLTLSLRAQGAAEPALRQGYTLAAGTVMTLDFGKSKEIVGVRPNTPLGFLGSARIEADGEIAAWSMVDVATSDKAVYAFAASRDEEASNELYAPMLRSRFFGYDTGVSVANPGDEPVRASLEYVGEDLFPGTCPDQRWSHGPVTIGAHDAVVFYQGPGGGSGMPEGCLASGTIRIEGGVAHAVVVDAQNFTEFVAAHNAIPRESAAERVLAPLVRSQHTAWRLGTGVQVMNVGAEETVAKLRFFDAQGQPRPDCGGACQATLPSGQAHTFTYNSMWWGLGGEGFGSAHAEADQPLAVIVYEGADKGAVDAAMYSGLPCGDGPSRVGLP